MADRVGSAMRLEMVVDMIKTQVRVGCSRMMGAGIRSLDHMKAGSFFLFFST